MWLEENTTYQAWQQETTVGTGNVEMNNQQTSKLNRNTTNTDQIQFFATATDAIVAAAFAAWSNCRGFPGTDECQNCSNQDRMEMHTLIFSIFSGFDILVGRSYVWSEVLEERLSMRLDWGFETPGREVKLVECCNRWWEEQCPFIDEIIPPDVSLCRSKVFFLKLLHSAKE